MMIDVQSYVAAMCMSIEFMKLTPSKKEFAKAIMRAAIEYANARHGMYASDAAKAVAMSPANRNTEAR